MRPRARLILPCLALLLLASSTMAAPRPRWRSDGNAIAKAPGVQDAPVAIGDGSGGMLVMWRDASRGLNDPDFRIQRVAASSAIAPGWPVDGALVATTQGTLPVMTGDGAGGALVLWQLGSEIRGQHLLADGSLPAGADPTGRLIVAGIGSPSWTGFTAAPDGAGGAYLVFTTFDFTLDHLMILRVNAEGTPAQGWGAPLDLRGVFYAFNRFAGVALATSPQGGAFALFSISEEVEPSGSVSHGHAARVTADGIVSWEVNLNTLLGRQVGPLGGVSDAADGVLFRLPDGTTQHLDGTGQLAWPAFPVAVTPAPLIADGVGGAYSVVASSPTPTVHRLAPDGTVPPAWAGGVPISSPFASFAAGAFDDGLMLAWRESSTGDLRATAVTRDGAIASGWSAAGNLVCRARGEQFEPTLVPLGGAAGLVAWTDTRRDEGDIFANLAVAEELLLQSRLAGPSASTGSGSFSTRATAVSCAAGRIRVQGTLDGSGEARIDVVDLAGRVLHRERFDGGAGPFERSLEFAPPFRGVYWLRVATPGGQATVRFIRLD